MTTKRKTQLKLVVFGILGIALTQILSKYISLPDFFKGIFTGVGIGLVLLALMVRKFKKA
ncbi:hypothetical protein [Aquimarina rhabdastrellae]